MTKAEARRILNCESDRGLAERLEIAYTTVWRWHRTIPKKYRRQIRLLALAMPGQDKAPATQDAAA